MGGRSQWRGASSPDGVRLDSTLHELAGWEPRYSLRLGRPRRIRRWLQPAANAVSAFLVAASLAVLGALAWLLVDPRKRLDTIAP